MILNDRQAIALELLANYKYLTSSQIFPFMGIKLIGTARRNLKILKDSKLIDKKSFGTVPGVGRLEDMHYLTRRGAELISEAQGVPLESIKYPIGTTSIFSKDYFHRKYTIDFNIAFSKWLEEEAGDKVFFDYYFDKSGENRTGKNPLKSKCKMLLSRGYIIADAVTKFCVNDKEFLFLFEQHNGHDTKRLYNQLQYYKRAFIEGAPSKTFNFERGGRLAVTLDTPATLQAIISRLSSDSDFEAFSNFFIFSLNSRLADSDFASSWVNMYGESVRFV